MSPSLSIIIPIYNAQEHLTQTLNSVNKQTYTDYECLLIDDGSTDNSFAICQKYAAQNPRFIAIHKNNGGVSSARNLGLDYAKGSYISFIDADDYIEPDTYASAIDALEAAATDISSYGVIAEKKVSNIPATQHDSIPMQYTKPIDMFFNDDLWISSLWNKVFTKEIIGNIRFQKDISYTEDILFCAEVMARAKTMLVLPDIKYHYLKHENTLSKNSGSFAFWGGHVRAMRKTYEIISAAADNLDVKEQAFNKYCQAIFSLVRLAIQTRDKTRYLKLKKEYNKDVSLFLASDKMDFFKMLTYKSYWANYDIASLFHYYLHKSK